MYVRPFMQLDTTMGVYHPLQYASDFWILRKEYIALNSSTTLEDCKIKFRAGTIPVSYFGYQQQFLKTLWQHKEWGVSTDADYDEYKRIFIETNPILFSVTCVVTILHTVFEYLAFRSDIDFWNNKKSIEGISV